VFICTVVVEAGTQRRHDCASRHSGNLRFGSGSRFKIRVFESWPGLCDSGIAAAICLTFAVVAKHSRALCWQMGKDEIALRESGVTLKRSHSPTAGSDAASKPSKSMPTTPAKVHHAAGLQWRPAVC
jgi:hypothetical protein